MNRSACTVSVCVWRLRTGMDLNAAACAGHERTRAIFLQERVGGTRALAVCKADLGNQRSRLRRRLSDQHRHLGSGFILRLFGLAEKRSCHCKPLEPENRIKR